MPKNEEKGVKNNEEVIEDNKENKVEDNNVQKEDKLHLIYPLDYVKVTSNFGARTYTLNGKKVSDFHYGTDFGWRDNPTPPIYCILDGVVQSCGTYSDGAIYAIVYHENINAISIYWHLSKLSVKKGQILRQGDIIGNMGKTGKATGNHLHLELWLNLPKNYILKWSDRKKYAVDPMEYLNKHYEVKEKIYIVKKGDTLTKIANKFNTTVDKLVKDNDIKNKNIILIGQKLIIK